MYVVGPARCISILPYGHLVASCALLANSVASPKRRHAQKVAPSRIATTLSRCDLTAHTYEQPQTHPSTRRPPRHERAGTGPKTATKHPIQPTTWIKRKVHAYSRTSGKNNMYKINTQIISSPCTDSDTTDRTPTAKRGAESCPGGGGEQRALRGDLAHRGIGGRSCGRYR